MLKITLHTDLSHKTSNQTINVESMDRNSFATVSNLWLPSIFTNSINCSGHLLCQNVSK